MTRTQHSKASQPPRPNSKTSWHQCFHIHGSMSSTVQISTFQIPNVSTVKDANIPTIQASSVSTVHGCESLHASRLQPSKPQGYFTDECCNVSNQQRLHCQGHKRFNVPSFQCLDGPWLWFAHVKTATLPSSKVSARCSGFPARRFNISICQRFNGKTSQQVATRKGAKLDRSRVQASQLFKV